jgi:hypothetical protein
MMSLGGYHRRVFRASGLFGQMGVPVVPTISRKRAMIFWVMGPGLPVPRTR